MEMELDIEALQLLEEAEPDTGLFPCASTCAVTCRITS